MAPSSPRMVSEARFLDSSVAGSPTSSASLAKTRSGLVPSLVRETWPASKLADDAGRTNHARPQHSPLNLKDYRLCLSSLSKQDVADSTDEPLTLSPDLKTLAAAFKSSPPLWVSREITEAIKRQESGQGDGWHWRIKPVQVNVAHSGKPVSGAVPNGLFPSLRHFVSGKDENLSAVTTTNCTSLAVGATATDKLRPRLRWKDMKVGGSEAWKLAENFPYGSRTNDSVYQRSTGSQISRPFFPIRHQLRPGILKHHDRPSARLSVAFSSPAPVDLTDCQENWKHREKAPEESSMADRPTCPVNSQGLQDKDHDGGVRDGLTCLQLADTILGQAKVRYVDILERSVSYLNRDCLERRSHGVTSSGVRSSTNDVAGQVTPKAASSHSTAVHAEKHSQTTQEDGIRASGDNAATKKATQAADIGRKSGETRDASSDNEQQGRRTSFPRLDSADRHKSGKVTVTDTGKGGEFTLEGSSPRPGVSRCATGMGCSKKPILKSSQQRWPAHCQSGYDVLSGRVAAVNSVHGHSNGISSNVAAGGSFLHVAGTTVYPVAAGSTLHVAGTTVYPVAAGSNANHQSHHNKESNRKCFSTCDAANCRKRAVRFSVSDQVYEFAPSDPVVL